MLGARGARRIFQEEDPDGTFRKTYHRDLHFRPGKSGAGRRENHGDCCVSAGVLPYYGSMTDASAANDSPGSAKGPNTAKALAFYLPQFHPIPENDRWWGKGFTEWTNVTKARPRFPGHYQPHVPTDLGYYDLRLPEVRQAQAQLAREHGIHGFVYYHYWFNGKRLLERPFDEVLASGSPDFPFALCWANEEWTRNWDAMTGEVLMPQEYSEEDDLAHARYLVNAFKDPRYIKIHGRPVMLIYRTQLLPDPERTFRIWREEAARQGVAEPYLCFVESWGPPKGGPQSYGMDASVGFMPVTGDQIYAPVEGTRGHRLIDYWSSVERQMRRPNPTAYKRFPSVVVSWDNSARRPQNALIFEGASPGLYEKWLDWTVRTVAHVPEEENYVFILAWNEWAEGNHLEPDKRYGRAWLEATRNILVDGPPGGGTHAVGDSVESGEPETDRDTYNYFYDYDQNSAYGNAVGLIRDLQPDRSRTIVDLGAGAGLISKPIEELGIHYHGLDIHPVAVESMRDQGISASQCDVSDLDAVRSSLDSLGDIGSFLLIDVLEHLLEPQELLLALSEWALKHDEPTLVISVPNVSHFDIALRLLAGRWLPTTTGILDSTHIRFFTEETLTNLVLRSGWEIVARDNYATVKSDQYDVSLADALPPEMVGALRVLSGIENPNAAVQQFVWALRPVPVTNAPRNYLKAVGASEREANRGPTGDMAPLYNYLATAGLLASEAGRRAIASQQDHRSAMGGLDQFSTVQVVARAKARAIAFMYQNPQRGRLFRRLYYWLR